MSQDLVIEARQLRKLYGNWEAVKGVTFHVNRGECFGLLGPNGAGKSSTMRMMYAFSPVTTGELYVLGLNVSTNSKRVKAQIGVVPQEDGLDTDFSVIDNLLLFGRYQGMSRSQANQRASELLRFLQLEEQSQRLVEELSGGMRRRLAIARALMHKPQVLFLDEPTTGLDPQARYWIWEALDEMKRQGCTLVLTTHYMEEAERLCDRVALMDKGKILSEGTPSYLIQEQVGHEVVEFRVQSSDVSYFVSKVKEKFAYQVLNNNLRIFVKQNQSGKEVIDLISSDNILVRKASLNDVFLKLAGHELVDQVIDRPY